MNDHTVRSKPVAKKRLEVDALFSFVSLAVGRPVI